MENSTFELITKESEYKFTEDWFSRHKILWEKLLDKLQPKKILEIGAFEGRATTFMIEQCGKRNPLEIYCVDTWQGGVLSNLIHQDFVEVQKRFDKNTKFAIDNVPNEVKLHKIGATSLVGLGQLAAEGHHDFDLVYVDGSHIACDVFFDAAMAFQLCRNGGIIIFDDYREDSREPYIYPKIAIDAFVAAHADKIQHLRFSNEEREIPMDQLYQRYYWKMVR